MGKISLPRRARERLLRNLLKRNFSMWDATALLLMALNALRVITIMSNGAGVSQLRPTTVRLDTGEKITVYNGGYSPRGSCICGSGNFCQCNPVFAFDLIIADKEDDNIVWLVKRKDTGLLAHLGGHVKVGETGEQAAVRELREKTNIDISISDLALVGVYGDPTRESRLHLVSAAFLIILPYDVNPMSLDEGSDLVRVNIMEDDALKPKKFWADYAIVLQDYKRAKISNEIIGSIRGDVGTHGEFIRSVCSQ